MNGRNISLSRSVMDNRITLTFELDRESLADAQKVCDDLRGERLSVDIKKYHHKRSLDANAYCWVLLGKIADALHTSKDECYFEMLKRYGQGCVIKIRNENAPMILRELKYYEPHEKLNEEAAVYYRVWVGSSNYDTKEMSDFIEGIVSECKELGIETMTPTELNAMLSRWGK